MAPLLFESYAKTLHASFWLIWIEFGLIAITLTHISLTLTKTLKNSQTGNTSSLVSRRKDLLSVLAARSQPIGGIVLLLFLLIHLEQLRFPRPPDGVELSTLHSFLLRPSNLIIYILGSLALFLHLFHGIESSQRSLGSLNSQNASLIRAFGRGLSFFIGSGFVLLTVLFGSPLIIE